MAISSREEIRKIISGLTKADIEHELRTLANQPELFKTELDSISSHLSDKTVDQGKQRFGSNSEFIRSIEYFIATKAALQRKGLAVGIAAGASAALFYKSSEICHDIACSSGVSFLDEIGDGIEIAADFSLDIAELGFNVAFDLIGLIGDMAAGIRSIFN